MLNAQPLVGGVTVWVTDVRDCGGIERLLLVVSATLPEGYNSFNRKINIAPSNEDIR